MIEIGGIRAVLTDIEGTTSSLAFVKDVLFPYARRSLPAFVRDHEAQLSGIRSEIEALSGQQNLSAAEMVRILLRWMDEDQKITPLKSLQGMVWKTGYESGELQSHVYEDAVRGLRRWHASGLHLYVYSSGSVPAQKLLFAHTAHGDLLPLLRGYFDTTTGPKLESASYVRIARSLELEPRSIVFLSDHIGETRAATAAGLQTILLARADSEAPTTECPVARS
ncbi:MAG TPA: acireductone synthase, partial [Steroidobacteraceae bacterium]